MSSVLSFSEAASLAFHGLAVLAVNRDRLISTREIATALNGSEAHMSKIMQRLVKGGFVASSRGPNGGFSLRMEPADICLLNVYELIEGPLNTTGCLISNPICGGNKCVLGRMVRDLNQTIRATLSSTTLEQLLNPFSHDPSFLKIPVSVSKSVRS